MGIQITDVPDTPDLPEMTPEQIMANPGALRAGEADELGFSAEDAAEVVKEMIRIDTAPVDYYLSSGVTIIDLALANRLPGGFAGGRISHIYGEESSSKTLLAIEAMVSAQRLGGKAYIADAEHTFEFARAEAVFGLQLAPAMFGHFHPESIEDLFDNHFAAILKSRKKTSGPVVVITDSLSALGTKAELAEDISKVGYDTNRAKIIGKCFRKWQGAMADADITLIFIDQARDDPSVVWGDKMTFGGGKALRFYGSSRLQMKHAGKLVDDNKVNLGIKVKFLVDKNKIAPPFRGGTYALYFDYGADDITSSLMWLKEFDVAQYEGIPKTAVGDDGKRRKTEAFAFGSQVCASIGDMVRFIEANNLEQKLREQVEFVWRAVYKPLDRKPRMRF